MKKRLISMLLALALLCACLPQFALPINAATSGKCGDNLTWSFNGATLGTLTISGTGDMWDFDYEGAPWQSYHNKIQTVSLPAVQMTSIGKYAFFNCSSLTNINIPNGLTSIGDSSFSDCGSLTNITLPGSVTYIGENAFSCCDSLKNVTIPDGVTYIGMYAFDSCESLKNITIPGSVTAISDCAFRGCKSLTTVKIGNGVSTIRYDAFYGCECLSSINIPDSVKELGTETFCGCRRLASIQLPEGLTSMGAETFMGCDGLTSIVIPKNVTSISYYLFAGCSKLTSVFIPSGVTEIYGRAFKDCNNLKDVYFGGTKSDWDRITVEIDNDPLQNARIHFNAVSLPFCNYTAMFHPDYFSKSSQEPNPDLALFSGILSWAVYHDDDKPSIRSVYSELGISGEDYFDNSNVRDNDQRFSIAKKTISIDGKKTNLLLISVRGTVTRSEAILDGLTQANENFQWNNTYHRFIKAYDWIYSFYKKIMKQLNDFHDSHKELGEAPLKVLVTGHSLGGAAANLVAANLTEFASGGAWWSDVVSKEDIYCYTFGAIDSIKTDGTVYKGYENIHNITNFYDTFGPDGWKVITAAGHSRYGKFGHIDLFYDDRDRGVLGINNHLMPTYLDAIIVRDSEFADNKIYYEDFDKQKIISYHCPVDIAVYQNDKLIGQIINNEVVESVTKIPMCVVGDIKYVSIQDQEEYRFEATATDQGTMAFSCYDAATGNQRKTFSNVKLAKNKKMFSEIGGTIEMPEIKLFVVDKKGIPVAEVQEDGNEVPVTNPFFDVKKGSFYYDAVLWAVNHDPQITNGMDATHFGPEAGCTRGQVVTFLWRAAGCPEPASKKNPFQDVKQGAFYYKAVLWAVDKSITKGTSATTFGPNDTCTRGQIVTFLYRFKGSSKAVTASNPFKDVSKTAFYYPAMLWAVDKGVTNGTSKTTFSPGATCTRGQVVTFLYRASRE